MAGPGRHEGPRADPAQGRDPRSAGPGRRARAAGAGLRGRRATCTSAGWSSWTCRTPSRVPEMCEKLLANPLIEDYEIQLKFGVVRFPGSCDEVDALLAARRVGEAELLWHADADLRGVDAVIVPGGFSYGDYLRVRRDRALRAGDGRGRALRAPRRARARDLQRVPGAVRGRAAVRARCCRTRRCGSPAARSGWRSSTPRPSWTGACSAGEPLSIPAKHTTGRYWAPDPVLDELEANGQVVLRYARRRELQRLRRGTSRACRTRPATSSG